MAKQPGFGKPGYCLLCAQPWVPDFDKGIRQGWNAAQGAEWAKRHAFTFNRQTFYKHKPHALTPEQRVVQISTTKNKSLAIKRGSNTSFLEAIRDIGYSKAIDDPEHVSIEHALKAVALLEGRKDKGSDTINLLVAVVSGGQMPGLIIEGESKEL